MNQRTGDLRVEIKADAKDADHTTLDLYRWLEQDPDVRDHAVLGRRSSHPGAGTMGSVEIIDLVLGQGIALANFALSYCAWRTARPAAPAITITGNGRTVTLEGSCDAETVRRLLESLDTGARTGNADEPQHHQGEPGDA